MTGGIRRHVGEHDIGRAAEQRLDRIRRARLEEIAPDEVDPRRRRHVEAIDRDDLAPALPTPGTPGRDLAPAARRGAEVDDARAWLEQMVLVVDLDELERGASAKALALGAGDIWVVELPLEP